MTASEQIDARIAETAGWRGERYAQLRSIITESVPEMVEVWKWDTAVWRLTKNVVAVSAFTGHVKINFFNGASLRDDNHLFNNGLNSKLNRSIDFAEHDDVPVDALRALIQQAAAQCTR